MPFSITIGICSVFFGITGYRKSSDNILRYNIVDLHQKAVLTITTPARSSVVTLFEMISPL